ncbi:MULTISPECIES: cytochrome c-type biogenesis protein [Vibrio]|uniref:Cytochrome c-type biogenesis protein n=2 Tax=Vibrio TaxID=662 RepID=A0A7X4RSV5_9VIBR|nr:MULTISPECIES: cytochrome c-type biogenesis protein [Vibrio]MBF8999564.1 cytochrome c-type biogenesis protein CcmH [Vibrio nitrifigilis]MZI92136.1 cytochrome c-type biogenesis protein CcmH [Vibrio eleionomae]
MIKRLIPFVLALVMSLPAMAAIEVFNFDSPQQEEQFKELSSTLRCPKCQNNTIADSNAALAQDLREKVYHMTKEGKSKQEIVDYMVARYGNFITYKPPFNASTLLLWLGPILVIFVGFTLLIMRSKRRRELITEKEWNEEKEAQLKALFEQDKQGERDQ